MRFRFPLTIFLGAFTSLTAVALELDWTGQFRTEFNFVKNYTLTNTDAGTAVDSTRAAAGGYYVRPAGTNDAKFQTLFLRLRPKLIVNDNVFIKSEWWLGDPVFGLFGDAFPYTSDQRQFYSNQSRGVPIRAQRFWAELLSDVGTVQLGRAPLHWGLGIVWNNGDGFWDRYQSTGDVIRLISKFGAFTFTPSLIYYSAGNTIGGSCNVASSTSGCVPGFGTGGLTDFSLMFKYDSPDEDFDIGINFIRRLAGSGQDTVFGIQGPLGSAAGLNFNTWDLYGRKRLGKFSLAGEVPITSGSVAGMDYSTVAFATEVTWKVSDGWDLSLKAGHAPGQPNSDVPTPDRYKGFFFNPAYRVGMIMFNYQLANFAGPNTFNNPNLNSGAAVSPYDHPVVDADYLAFGGAFRTDRWTFHGDWIYARAPEVAKAGRYFFNNWSRQMVLAGFDQTNALGWEIDTGATFQWDENFLFGVELGLFMPGGFYRFSNTATENDTSSVFAATARVGVTF